MAILLDTHILIWFANGDKEISPKMQNKINAAINEGELYISAITLWEIAMLDTKGRIHLQMPYLTWVKQLLNLTKAKIVELSPDVVYDSCNLPGKFHEDPADRLIVASARSISATLLTKDKRIISYGKLKNVMVAQHS